MVWPGFTRTGAARHAAGESCPKGSVSQNRDSRSIRKE